MSQQKQLRQVMSPADIYAHAEALCEMLRDHYGSYDADSLEEVMVDESFVQRIKARGYDLLPEGATVEERPSTPPPSRRELPRAELGSTPMRRSVQGGTGGLPLRRREPTNDGADGSLPTRRRDFAAGDGESALPLRRREPAADGDGASPIRRPTGDAESAAGPRRPPAASEGDSGVPERRRPAAGTSADSGAARKSTGSSRSESSRTAARPEQAAQTSSLPSPDGATPPAEGEPKASAAGDAQAERPTPPAPRARRTTRAKPSSDGQSEG